MVLPVCPFVLSLVCDGRVLTGAGGILTGGVPCHLDDALAFLPHLSGVEGSNPHRHLDGGRGHGASGWVGGC